LPRRKSSTVAQAEPRRAKHGSSTIPRWLAGVSAEGDLFLRRVHGDHELYSPVQYSFSQGLTFVARRWRNVMNEALLAVGQSHVRWGTLYWITVFGDRVNQTQLAERMGIEQPTLGRVLRELEADGLIQRRAPKGDRRARVIELTPASKPLMQRINQIQNTIRNSLVKDIRPEELAACLTVFAKILDNADRVSENSAD
jgi:MarR family transcriptional regulator, transcriptional regulator for hemolysin